MLRSLFFIGLSACLSVVIQAQPIKLVGSDLVVGSIDVELQKFAKENELKLSFELKGSRLGMEELNKPGGADLGLLVFGNEDSKPGPEFRQLCIGYFTAVVAVPKSLEFSQATFNQLAGIYGARELSDIRRWEQLGVTGSQAQRSILTVATGRRGGLALDIFRYGVMQKPDLKPTVTLLDNATAAAARVNSDEGGMVLLPSPFGLNANLKVLLVSKTERGVAYGPTPENLHSGDYPLRLPVYLVFRKSDTKRLNFVIRHLLADETNPVLAQAGIIPLPVQARNQLVFELETQ